MSALCLEELRRDESTPVPEPIELRLKWMLNAYHKWERWLVWRNGNSEWPICIVPDPSFDLTDPANAKDQT